MNTLPEQFIQNMAERLGDELPAFLRSYEEPYLRGIRLNPLKPVEDSALPEGIGEPVPWEPQGRYLAMDSDAGATPLHEAGAFYLQEPSAMLPAAVLNPQPGERVLDLCAAPGGKSTQLGLRMAGQGLLVCNEPVP
ncbi:MAG: RNA methyltransferase, partial [Aristaeellaceae bacterium]